MENSVFLYPNVKSSPKYTFTVIPTHHTSMAWTRSRALPDDATSPKQCQWHSQSCILLYIHHDLTWAKNIKVFCLETTFSWSIYTHWLFTDTRAQSPPKYRITTETTRLPHCLLASFFLQYTFSPFSIKKLLHPLQGLINLSKIPYWH